MTTSIQDRLRDDEPALLRGDIASLVDDWAAVLLDVRVRELPDHPEADVLSAQLTATELLRAELDRYSRLLERQAWAAGLTLPEIGEARGVSPQAVSQRIKSPSQATVQSAQA